MRVLCHARPSGRAQPQIGIERGHHLVELREVQRLLPVAPGLVRVGMHLHQQPVRARGHRNPRQCRHQLAMAGRMAGIGDHRQMRNLLQQCNGRRVERVPRRGLKRAYAAFAKNHLRVAVFQHYLRGLQKIGHRGHHAAL